MTPAVDRRGAEICGETNKSSKVWKDCEGECDLRKGQEVEVIDGRCGRDGKMRDSRGAKWTVANDGEY